MFHDCLNVGILTMEVKSLQLLQKHSPKQIIFGEYRGLLNLDKTGVSCREDC